MRATGDYELDDDPGRLDLDAIWSFLSTEAYWGRDRARAQIEQQIASAWRVVGAYAPGGAQVGFARALSDGVSSAYLADVYVTAQHRGHGLGAALVEEMIDNGPGAGLRWILNTSDAHGLYRRFGFGRPDRTMLERAARPPLDDPWELAVAEVWAECGEDEVMARIEALVAQEPHSPRARYELASAYDTTGRETEAEPEYRAALDAGLDDQRRSRALIQLASTLRNLGRPEEALDVLATGDDPQTATERAAFAALALFDAGRPGDAVATALEALAPLLRYERAVTSYARELREAPPVPRGG